MPLKPHTPLPHQEEVIHFITKKANRSVAVIHGTGCGKTFTAIASCKELLKQKPNTICIIAAPKSVHGNFYKEIERIGDLDPSKFLIVTHQFFLNRIDIDKIHEHILVVDEVHNLRTKITHAKKDHAVNGGKTAYNLLASSFRAWKVIVMTATPIVNTAYDLVNLFSFVNGKYLYREKGLAVSQFEILDHTPSYLPQHLIYAYMKNISFKEKPTHSENKNYPDLKIETIDIKMSPQEEKNYDICRGELEGLIEDELSKRIGSMGKQHFMCFMNAMRRVSDSGIALIAPKIRYTIDYILDNPQHKVVIFSSWLKAAVNVISKDLKHHGIKHGKITGKITKKDREWYVDEFNSNKIKVILLTKAGGEGLDLKGVDRVFILEPAWNPVVEDQAMSRAVRYQSHNHLPEHKRVVHTIKMLIKYKGKKDLTIDELLTINYIDKKKVIAEVILEYMKEASMNIYDYDYDY